MPTAISLFRKYRLLGTGALLALLIPYVSLAKAGITVATVPVDNPGNAPDTTVASDGTSGYGEVDYDYNIAKYDVTAGQYCAFLNAVAATDTYGLYNANMLDGYFAPCGIVQEGTPGNYTYAPTKNPNFPVNYVTFWDAARFANWLANGQPTGSEGPGTTETGTYTLTSAAIANNSVTRNPNSTWSVASENEWYKAAYYDPSNATYYEYATQSDTLPSNVLSATGQNNANYYAGGYTDPVNYLTAVGAFASSPSAYGTYDQAGDVMNWNDAIVFGGRGLRGSFVSIEETDLPSSIRSDTEPTYADYSVGFRVSEVPEPATTLSLLAMSSLTLLQRRRRAR